MTSTYLICFALIKLLKSSSLVFSWQNFKIIYNLLLALSPTGEPLFDFFFRMTNKFDLTLKIKMCFRSLYIMDEY